MVAVHSQMILGCQFHLVLLLIAGGGYSGDWARYEACGATLLKWNNQGWGDPQAPDTTWCLPVQLLAANAGQSEESHEIHVPTYSSRNEVGEKTFWRGVGARLRQAALRYHIAAQPTRSTDVTV